jgi:hypothetical protein
MTYSYRLSQPNTSRHSRAWMMVRRYRTGLQHLGDIVCCEQPFGHEDQPNSQLPRRPLSGTIVQSTVLGVAALAETTGGSG